MSTTLFTNNSWQVEIFMLAPVLLAVTKTKSKNGLSSARYFKSVEKVIIYATIVTLGFIDLSFSLRPFE